jgi:hypothetical protein
MAMLKWNRVFDRWWCKHFSWQLCRKTIISAGLAGSVLLVLALHMSVQGLITYFARFLCGYLGLVFCAVSLGCGVRVLIDSIRAQSHIFAKWSKLFASFLDWFRHPIRLLLQKQLELASWSANRYFSSLQVLVGRFSMDYLDGLVWWARNSAVVASSFFSIA